MGDCENEMKRLHESEILNEYLACPYCYAQVDFDRLGCCGESSAHFESAYETEDEVYLACEVEVVKTPVSVEYIEDLEKGGSHAEEK